MERPKSPDKNGWIMLDHVGSCWIMLDLIVSDCFVFVYVWISLYSPPLQFGSVVPFCFLEDGLDLRRHSFVAGLLEDSGRRCVDSRR